MSSLKPKRGEQWGCPFVQTKESVICQVTFSSLRHRGGFDRQDFFSPSFGAANDITEIVFEALPGSGTPGKASGSGGQEGRERGGNRERINNWFIIKPLKV